MKVLTRLLSVAACVVAGFAGAAEYQLNSGVTDWTQASSYVPAQVPGAGDTVVLPANETFEVDAASGSFATLSAFKRIVPSAGSKLVITVSEGEKTLGCAFNAEGESSKGSAIGELVKKGAGLLQLGSVQQVKAANGYAYDYCTQMTLAEGRLALVAEDAGSYRAHYGTIVTSNDTLLVVTAGKKAVWAEIEYAAFDGDVTNANASVQRILNILTSSRGTSRVCGRVDGKIRFWNSGSVDFLRDDLTFTDNVTLQSWNGKPDSPSGIMGVTKFGTRTGDDLSSSLGTSASFCAYGDGGFRYLGTVPDWTDKTFTVYGLHTFFDGGAYGGLEYAGAVNNTKDTAKTEGQHQLILTGSNTVACTFSGTMSGNNDVAGTQPMDYSFYLIKRGTGTWNLTGNKAGTGNGWTGGVAVEEGTLGFDSVAEAGMDCSLGKMTKLTDGQTGLWDPAHMVDYAIALGSASPAAPATLEYVGDGQAVCTTRPIALVGEGGTLRANAGPLKFSGVSARDANATPTLTLDGTSTAGNVIREISDGAAGAKVNLAKAGGGTWKVGGNFAVGGDVKVAEGKLSIQVPEPAQPPVFKTYKWFRLSIAELRQKTNELSRVVDIRQVALFDKDGIRQDVGLTFPAERNLALSESGYYYVCATDLEPGEAAYDASIAGKTIYGAPQTLARLFSGEYAGDDYYSVTMPSNPDPSDAKGWLRIVMRLPDTANPITHFDIEGRYNYFNYMPSRLKMEGSLDGRSWETLWSNVESEKPAVVSDIKNWNRWISDAEAGRSDNRPLGKGFTHSATGEDVPANPFTWFRLTVAEIQGGGNQLQFRQLCLFDKAGDRQNVGLTLAEDTVPQNGVTRTIATREIGPGEVGYDPSVNGYKVKPSAMTADCALDLPAMFNNVTSSNDGRYQIAWMDPNGTALTPTPSDPKSWIPIVMHLAPGAKPVTHFDILALYYIYEGNTKQYLPSRMKLEGSTDGENWTEVFNNIEGEAWNLTLTGWNHWMSDNSTTSGHPAGSGFTLSKLVPDPVVYAQSLDGFVEVAAGATLESTQPFALGKLRVDAEGAGTLSNFVFAATGSLDVVHPQKGGTFTLPGTYVSCSGIENVADWAVSIGGVAKPHYQLTVSPDGKISVVPPGTLLIVR